MFSYNKFNITICDKLVHTWTKKWIILWHKWRWPKLWNNLIFQLNCSEIFQQHELVKASANCILLCSLGQTSGIVVRYILSKQDVGVQPQYWHMQKQENVLVNTYGIAIPLPFGNPPYYQKYHLWLTTNPTSIEAINETNVDFIKFLRNFGFQWWTPMGWYFL
jgi:hypothetical protein